MLGKQRLFLMEYYFTPTETVTARREKNVLFDCQGRVELFLFFSNYLSQLFAHDVVNWHWAQD